MTLPAPPDPVHLPRWVWPDTRLAYPPLLAEGRRIERCWDLRLCRLLLERAAWVPDAWRAQAPPWPAGALDASVPVQGQGGEMTLFEPAQPAAVLDVRREYLAQLAALDAADNAGRLRLLLAAESAGALAAEEIRHAGIPFDTVRHDELLTTLLGPRPAAGAKPQLLAQLAEQVCAALDAPTLNLDSQPAVVRALHRAGLDVSSTRSWELRTIDHPAIEPLLRYKKLARLLTANGWHWADQWVHSGRFHASYVVGGVVTGRWATDGGGAQQFPAELRAAIRAEPGWVLVVADAAQLEPRILAALARDEAMAQAGRGADLYQGIVEAGAAPDRARAKVGMLSALYGGTAGAGGDALPLLRRVFPAAIGYVERAAAAGERGEQVVTHLGRTSPKPGAEQLATERDAYLAEDPALSLKARSAARSWGRFTRNFVVQGTAAEWAECWLAATRRELAALPRATRECGAPAPFADRAHLVYFLHDELVIHAPAEQAGEVAAIVQRAAGEAAALMFGQWPGTFPLHVDSVEDLSQADH